MTAAVFEDVIVPRVRNEVSKTKLHFNLSPVAGINLVLPPVRVHRYLIWTCLMSTVIVLSRTGLAKPNVDWKSVICPLWYVVNFVSKIAVLMS